MMTEATPLPDLAIPPGEYLQEVLAECALTQAELARRMGRPAQTINEIIKGEKAITPQTALQLEQVVGVSAYFWSNLETQYRLIQEKAIDEKKAEREISTALIYPYAELAKLGLVAKARNSLLKVKELRAFFGITSLSLIPKVQTYAPAFRQSKPGSPEALAAWLWAGRILASRLEVNEYSKSQLKATCCALRALSFETEFDKLAPKLRDSLAECGIALVLLPHFAKTYTTGATFWLKGNAVIMMSLRGSWSDMFWFSLFHEIGHILLHDKRITFLEHQKKTDLYLQQEKEADAFARETLIPDNAYADFVDKGDFTEWAIKEFAQKVGIFPGIVTGRLQYDKKLSYREHIHRIRFK